MNNENLLRVANTIERFPDQFNMGSWGYNFTPHTCGTVACIAGFAAHLAKENKDECVVIFSTAASYLGLDPDDAESLFTGGGNSIWEKYAEELQLQIVESIMAELYVPLETIRPIHAVTLLRKLASGEWTFS